MYLSLTFFVFVIIYKFLKVLELLKFQMLSNEWTGNRILAPASSCRKQNLPSPRIAKSRTDLMHAADLPENFLAPNGKMKSYNIPVHYNFFFIVLKKLWLSVVQLTTALYQK